MERPRARPDASIRQGVHGRAPPTAWRLGPWRTVELDRGTIGVLLAHRLQQDQERRVRGRAYVEHGLVFARADGQPISPEMVSKRFRELALAAGLRPVRLHDLRHGAASRRLAAGAELSVISKQLGHSTITLTSNTYSHLLEDVGRQAAERAMALVPRPFVTRRPDRMTNP